mgnify:CR=1 FL=1
MQHSMGYTGLQIGMFLGGLLMALVPIVLAVGLGVWAFRQRGRTEQSNVRTEPNSQEIS